MYDSWWVMNLSFLDKHKSQNFTSVTNSKHLADFFSALALLKLCELTSNMAMGHYRQDSTGGNGKTPFD